MRDFLENFPTEKVEIHDDNNIITEVDGLFGTEYLTITDTSVPLIEGQIVLRTLPNGHIEKYKITDSKYVKGMGNICDCYKLSIIKIDKDEKNNIIYNDNSIHIGNNNTIKDSIFGNDNR